MEGEKYKAIAPSFKDGKEGIAEFDVIFKDGKPYAIVGPAFGGAAVELRELLPSRLLKKDADYDYFYMVRLNLDRTDN
jgi:hypothetical protein